MNIDDSVKKYQLDRRLAADYADSLKTVAVNVLQELQELSRFSNTLSDGVSYRKMLLQDSLVNVTDAIENVLNQLRLLNNDFNIVIQTFIAEKRTIQLREERKNAK